MGQPQSRTTVTLILTTIKIRKVLMVTVSSMQTLPMKRMVVVMVIGIVNKWAVLKARTQGVAK